MTFKPLITAVCIALMVSSCAKSPLGRSQLKLYPSNQMDAMGIQAFDSMKSEQKVSQTKVTNSFVSCVADYITRQVPKSVFAGEWEVVVFEDDQVNAFALPGGKIGVYTGLLKVTENQHQLAAVMGHEVGHVIAEHGNERMSNSTLIGVGMEVTNQLLNANQIANNNMIMAAIGLGVQVGVQLPFSRTHETEADIIGLQLMAQAGFDPRQSVNLWQNMDKASGGQRQLEFLSTHPAPATRIEDLQNNMDGAMNIFTASAEKPNCRK
ncbi:M48 family metallopeptidase [Aliiglaciecola sp. CAU 1673]|uniref:M48 family metallopeptidase n=1 Tax=Aliiglaciecola sp. CAU 1673 TaxID=3032595 RepID=UPI0023D98D0F|nr:M48 family metallopeptidase [Aliiglaciecola sp. CAU 1673]MDF2179477.1 M48 family metallopeptidase [Aliiglaciecola sp. CAU 1673]